MWNIMFNYVWYIVIIITMIITILLIIFLIAKMFLFLFSDNRDTGLLVKRKKNRDLMIIGIGNICTVEPPPSPRA